MELFLNNHKEFLEDLVNGGVDFIIIGGYAVIFHGYVRTTGDLDIWLKPDEANKVKLMAVLDRRGISRASLHKLHGLNFTETAAFHIGEAPERIDFITGVTGLSFDPAFARSVILKLASCNVRVIHLEDLITNKMMTIRLKDKADVEELQKVRNISRNLE